LFRHIFGVWITENQVKDALYQLGYEASAMTKQHWHYKIRELRDPGVCPSDARFLMDTLQYLESSGRQDKERLIVTKDY
jgi:hypothetical protein